MALSALTVSVVSLLIARRQTEVMDRQLGASVWPAIQYSTSNLRGGEPVITFSIENVGVGPARIRTFTMSHQGRVIENPTEFVRECCAPKGTPFRTITSFVEGRIMPAGQEVTFFTLHEDPEHPEIYRALERIRSELEVRVCYCSVLEECWVETDGGSQPERVGSCEARERRRSE